MKAVTVKELKAELENLPPKELRELCLRLSKFKKENKELLTYLLFESSDEEAYIEEVKKEIDTEIADVNRKSNYQIRKGLRRVLMNVKKYNRYSGKKKTEIDLLIYYCTKLKSFRPSIRRSAGLLKIYLGLIETIRKKLAFLHDDLQYDYGLELNALIESDKNLNFKNPD